MTELGSEYWTLANAITAFAVAQSLVFAYAVAQHGERIRSIRGTVTLGILFGVVAFCFAVWFCNHAQTELLGGAPPKRVCLLWWTMVGRTLAIIGYAGFGLSILWASVPRTGAA